MKVPNIISREEETVLHFDSIDALADYVDYPVYYLADEKAEIEGISLVESRQMGERISVVYQKDILNSYSKILSTGFTKPSMMVKNQTKK